MSSSTCSRIAALALSVLLAAVALKAEDAVIRSADDAPNAYAIGVGDVLEISVWKNPDLAVTVPVRPDGRIRSSSSAARRSRRRCSSNA